MRRLSMVSVLLIGLCAAVLWAAWFEIDETVRARGKIVVQGHVQVIQSPEGGVLRELLVAEGDRVVAGQVLAVMDSDVIRAAVDEVAAEIETNQIARIRAEAELAGTPPDFGPLAQRYPSVAAAQMALYEGNVAQEASETAFAQRQLDIARAQLSAVQALAGDGDVSRADVARAERDVIQSEGAVAAIAEKYRAQSRKDIATIQQQISMLEFRLAGRRTSLDFTRLTAPRDGIVTQLKTNTLGAVLRPGDELMRISPTGSERIAEVRFAPIDVGRLAVGQAVTVQLDSFSSTIYGSLEAELAYVSADSLTEPDASGRNMAYYLGRVVLAPAQRNTRIDPAAIRPGMEVTVDVKTGRRTVLTYLAKPIVRAFAGAMSER